MNYYFTKERECNYLVVKDILEKSERAWHMILENDIPGFCKCVKKSLNGEEYLYYEITGGCSLSEFVYKEQSMSASLLSNLFSELYDAIMRGHSFFLKPEEICLESDFIIYCKEEGRWKFCYVPQIRKETNKELFLKFSECLLEAVDHEDEKAVVMVYQFHKMVTRMKEDDNIESFLVKFMIDSEETNKEYNYKEESLKDIINNTEDCNDLNNGKWESGIIQDEIRKREEIQVKAKKIEMTQKQVEDISDDLCKEDEKKINAYSLKTVLLFLILIIISGVYIGYCMIVEGKGLEDVIIYKQGWISAAFLTLGVIGLLFELLKKNEKQDKKDESKRNHKKTIVQKREKKDRIKQIGNVQNPSNENLPEHFII